MQEDISLEVITAAYISWFPPPALSKKTDEQAKKQSIQLEL